ncbi:MAG: sugar ABC transporter permease [Treponema sp.]|jgi:multiple sugar transport system permease protein/alpha-1,4-digalacturonate transport system permease protein|nr:sugar ABC transporter permease [Treponema sp.]
MPNIQSRVPGRTVTPFWNSLKVVPYLFILPNMFLFLVFMIIPLFMTGWYSLVKWSGLGDPKFIGLDNYFYIFRDEVFLRSLWNTIAFSAATVPLLMALSLAFALMLNRKIFFRGFFRSSMYLPSVVSTVVTGMVFIWLFDPQLGLINYIIGFLGGSRVEWSTDPRYAMVMVVIGTIWARTGYNMVIYLAALQGISPEYYEAAKIDGASPRQSFIHITMPLLGPTHMFVLITCVIHSFRSFDLIYVMTKGGPLNATKTLVVYVYDTAFKMNYFGRASAGGVVLFLVLLAFTLIRMKSEKAAV